MRSLDTLGLVMEADEWAEQLRATLATLEAVLADRALLDVLPVDERHRLLAAAGDVFNPDADARRQLAKEQRRREKAEKVRASRRCSIGPAFVRAAANRVPFAERVPTRRRSGLELGSAETDAPADRPHDARHCYVCKQHYTEVHHFYDQMCPACGDFNFTQAHPDRRPARPRRAGHRRAGQDRLPGRHHAAARRRARDRHHALPARRGAALRARAGLRRLGPTGSRSTASICATRRASRRSAPHLTDTRDRLDFMINNACQTVRRPPGFYEHC